MYELTTTRVYKLIKNLTKTCLRVKAYQRPHISLPPCMPIKDLSITHLPPCIKPSKTQHTLAFVYTVLLFFYIFFFPFLFAFFFLVFSFFALPCFVSFPLFDFVSVLKIRHTKLQLGIFLSIYIVPHV